MRREIFYQNEALDFSEYDDICDFEDIKDKIHAKLLNSRINHALLQTHPHRIICGDLAIIYYVEFKQGCIMNITNEMMLRKWHQRENTLYDLAINNLNVELKTLCEIMTRNLNLSEEERMQISLNAPPMWVLSNKWEHLGAASILDNSVLKNFHERHGEFYILPSSIHEVLLFPEKYADSDEDFLRDLVEEANRTTVLKEDFLSSEIYYYNGKEVVEL